MPTHQSPPNTSTQPPSSHHASSSHTSSGHLDTAFLFIGHHLALDFINTAYGTGDEYHEGLTDDASVVTWLMHAEALAEPPTTIPVGLVQQAKALRESAKALVNAATDGTAAEATLINQILTKGQPESTLAWEATQQQWMLIEQRRHDDIESLLYPIAKALGELLCHPQRQYIRQCEADDCVLMFLDTTKSHRRRWCSMALCGNRAKVAAHRKRAPSKQR